VSILNGIVQTEILEKRDEATKRYSFLFNREIGKDISFGKTAAVNKRDLNRLADDISLFSLMLELNYFEETDFLLIKNFFYNVLFEGAFIDYSSPIKVNIISQVLQNDSILINDLVDELKSIDTGISSLEFRKDKENFMKANTDGVDGTLEWSTIMTNHKVADKDYLINLSEESIGTFHYIETFMYITRVLQNGGLFIADELEQSLHPDLTARIINRFIDKDKNPNNAQLLFTTHNPWFLQDLTKTQIFITEKNEKAETEITRLDEIAGVRNDENYFIKYISGEYDGRPKIREN
jgi:AAA15 family ATPase/GTPase